MGVAGGPKISKDGLVFAIDSDSNVRGFTKYGTSGTNNNHRAIRNLVDRSSTFSTTNTSQLTGGVTYYTLYGLTYPESSQTPASRHGVTPGFENITAAQTYQASRDLNYYVFDENTNTWVPDSYFNGERINGHCYDTYDGQPSQHATFQADYDNIKNVFPNATHIVIGSHASENIDNDANTVTRLKEIGFPDDAVGLGRVEFVMAGKVNKPWTHHYVRENVSSAVANMVIGLPLEGKGGALTFDGTDDRIDLPNSLATTLNGNPEASINMWIKLNNQSNGVADTGLIQLSNYNNSNGNLYFYSNGYTYLDIFRTDRVSQVFANNTVTATDWHMLTITTTPGANGWKCYINGEFKSSTTGQDTVSVNSSIQGGLTLGRNSSSRYTNGNIAVCAIYDRALSAQEVQQNYNAYKNRFNL